MDTAIALFALIFMFAAWRFYVAVDLVAYNGNRAHVLQMIGVLLGALGLVPLLHVVGVVHPHAVLLAIWLGLGALYSVVMFVFQTSWTLTKVLTLLLAVIGPLLALHRVHVI